MRTKDHEFRNTESPMFTVASDSVRNRSFSDAPDDHRLAAKPSLLRTPSSGLVDGEREPLGAQGPGSIGMHATRQTLKSSSKEDDEGDVG
jgi:hypothetical protein